MENEILSMFRSGISIREIQRKTGVHRQKLSKIIKSHGGDIVKGINHEEVVSCFMVGDNIDDLSKRFGVTTITITRILNKHGISFMKKGRILSDKEREFIFDKFYHGVSIEDLAKELSCGKRIIQRFLQTTTDRSLLSLSHREDRWKNINSEEIAASYKKGITMEALSRENSTGIPQIRNILKKQNSNLRFKNKKYSVDHCFLDHIDSHEKAYFLGFFYGDGHHSVHKSQLLITIQSKDREVLDFFAREMNLTRPMALTAPAKVGYQEKITMAICSPQMSKKLTEFGVKGNKTYELDFPKFIPHEFINSFILGIFDADGCIYINRAGGIHFSICGTESICDGIYSFFKENDVDLRIWPHKSGIFYVGGHSRKKASQIKEILYRDSKISLSRKRIIFDIIGSMK